MRGWTDGRMQAEIRDIDSMGRIVSDCALDVGWTAGATFCETHRGRGEQPLAPHGHAGSLAAQVHAGARM